MMTSEGIKKDALYESEILSHGVNDANSALCVQCGKWINNRCAGIEGIQRCSDNFAYIKAILQKQWSRKGGKKMECQWFTYLGDSTLYTHVSTNGGCRFPIKLKGAVYKIYVRPAILHGSEAWCLKEI